MGPDIIVPAVMCILAVAMGLYVIGSLIQRRIQIKNYIAQDLSQPELVVRKAEVIHKEMVVMKTGSYKSPSHEFVYCVVFKLENGETEKYSVFPENFERCEVHDVGNLVTVDGEFFDFGDGEDI